MHGGVCAPVDKCGKVTTCPDMFAVLSFFFSCLGAPLVLRIFSPFFLYMISVARKKTKQKQKGIVRDGRHGTGQVANED